MTEFNAASDDRQALLSALESSVDELSRRAFEHYSRSIPSARQWSPEQRDAFVLQAKGRFGAVLAVIQHGSQVDEALRSDLERVGAAAATSGTELAHVLLVLRISRDLLLSTAMQLSVEKNHAWDHLLTGFATRLCSSVDSLNDALSHGYWAEKLDTITRQLEMIGNVFEHSPYGVYEADLDGIIRFANRALFEHYWPRACHWQAAL